MRFVQLKLENFGAYGQRQTFQLDGQSSKKNIILIGGKNGCGKTTFLDSLYIVLYGKQIQQIREESSSYDQFLKDYIHNNDNAGATISLTLDLPREGGHKRYTVVRHWKSINDRLKENFEVHSEEEDQKVVEENWPIIINEILPIRLSKLFFFDGEKIESLADLSASKDVLNDAINTLLGLDITDRLINDLSHLKRDKQKTTLNTESLQRFEMKEKNLQDLITKLKYQKEKRQELENEGNILKDEINNLSQQLEIKGEDLYLKKNEIQNEIFKLDKRKQDLEFNLRRLAGRYLPFFVLKQKITSLAERAQQEKQISKVKEFSEIIEDHDRAILSHLEKDYPDVVNSLQKFMNSLQEKNKDLINQTILFNDQEIQALIDFQSGQQSQPDKDQSLQNYKEIKDINRKLASLNKVLDTSPSQEAIQEIYDQIRLKEKDLQYNDHRLEIADREIKSLKYEMDGLERELNSYYEEKLSNENTQDSAKRIVRHAEKVQITMRAFKERVIAHHSVRLEQNITDSFNELIRKKNFISTVQINPTDLTISILKKNEERFDPDKFSAGERQLFAVAVIWGLVRTASQDIPAIIDTPMGRLDSEHRLKLVQNYFPKASKQTILLSTDEEIVKDLYDHLKPNIVQSYLLEFDDNLGATQIKEGYF
tara:strand:- start:1277 stop:3235 length:1959 start_codon:yes stop_codon:yes gene_type:complete